MHSRMQALGKKQVGIILLVIMTVSLAAFGCASSGTPGSYKLGFQGLSPKFNTSNWTIEHNLFNSKRQVADKEDWEEDWPS